MSPIRAEDSGILNPQFQTSDASVTMEHESSPGKSTLFERDSYQKFVDKMKDKMKPRFLTKTLSIEEKQIQADTRLANVTLNRIK